MTATQLAFTLAAATIAGLAWYWRAIARRWSWLQWFGGTVLLVSIVTFWVLVVSVLRRMPESDWNNARLAPVFALLYGYQLYYPATQGPILNHVYGPLGALAFLPATIFRTPTAAILAGGVLEVAFLFGALLWFVWRAAVRAPADQPRAVACGLGAALLLSHYPGTYVWISIIHPNAPTLALGLLACGALVTRDGAAPTTRALTISATATVLSCWTKQTAVPLAPALLVAVWIAHGRSLAWRYVLMLVAVGIAVSAVFLIWFGQPMWFNVVEVLSRHRWIRPGIGGLVATVGALLRTLAGLLALLAIGLAVAFTSRDRQVPLAAHPGIPPLLAALFLLPTGALGANKVGGDTASFLSLYYAVAAVAVLFADAGFRLPATRALAWAFCVWATVAAWQSGRCDTWHARPPLLENNSQRAYEFALRHTGEAYFPWHPLASLLAEGRLYHFDYGMVDRDLAGFRPTSEHVRANVPPHMRWIVSPRPTWSFSLFPEFSEPVNLPELPGWHARARPGSAPAEE